MNSNKDLKKSPGAPPQCESCHSVRTSLDETFVGRGKNAEGIAHVGRSSQSVKGPDGNLKHVTKC